MMHVKKDKPTVMHTQGFIHKPFVFRDFTAVRQAEPAPKADPAPEAEAVAVQEPVVPTFSEEQLQAARAEGEAAGYEKGLAAARQEQMEAEAARNAQAVALLETLLTRMDTEVAAYHAMFGALREEMAGIVLAIARKLAGNALEAQPLGAVESMVNECMTMLSGEAKLSIAVCPELETPMKTYLAKLRREGQMVDIVADPKMQPGDCRIQWPGGKAVRDQSGLEKEIEDIVMRALAAPDGENGKA